MCGKRRIKELKSYKNKKEKEKIKGTDKRLRKRRSIYKKLKVGMDLFKI